MATQNNDKNKSVYETITSRTDNKGDMIKQKQNTTTSGVLKQLAQHGGTD